jgi:Arc/MetJ-type ribon-helix-helix transcriptional regulator
MDVQLKPELAEFVADQVKKGKFSSPDQVLEAGLARLMLDPQAEELDDDEVARLSEFVEQMHRGKVVDWREASAHLRRRLPGE